MNHYWFAQSRYGYGAVDQYDQDGCQKGPVFTSKTKKASREVAELANLAYNFGVTDTLDNLVKLGHIDAETAEQAKHHNEYRVVRPW